ncbi:hypothetical protein [Aquitalea sp. LB_tupeE]|uniref:hypothetical protein n=1 Tax=Aquitalea sp. LB_tupeE TaxID=2748078 RepID=UPI0015BB22B8|nr:hypothetical protein [Aquitalea sp. LB_tupeE]NWK79610.1 hypothetical protein [Aquitalea sp. LB_tupeE]
MNDDCAVRRKTLFWRLRRLLTGPLVLLAALLIAFEEFAWDELSDLLARLGRWPVLRRLESAVARAAPAVALSLFLLPVLGLLPVKLAAVLLISRGHAVLGLLVILLAKLLGTAVAARLFTLTRNQLMRVQWFARAYQLFIQFKSYVHDRLAASPAWQAAHRLLDAVRARLRRSTVWSRMGRRMSRQWQHLRK